MDSLVRVAWREALQSPSVGSVSAALTQLQRTGPTPINSKKGRLEVGRKTTLVGDVGWVGDKDHSTLVLVAGSDEYNRWGVDTDGTVWWLPERTPLVLLDGVVAKLPVPDEWKALVKPLHSPGPGLGIWAPLDEAKDYVGYTLAELTINRYYLTRNLYGGVVRQMVWMEYARACNASLVIPDSPF